jgi:hypothetical protein
MVSMLPILVISVKRLMRKAHIEWAKLKEEKESK